MKGSDFFMSYNSYDHGTLKPAEEIKIERRVYFDSKKADISHLTALPLEQLQKMREESTAAEQTIFANFQDATKAWEVQAGQTLSLNKAIEYVRTPPIKHTSNEWATDPNNSDRKTKSNNVYVMSYHVYERQRYDKEAGKSVPVASDLTWSVRTHAPGDMRGGRIAGQDKKVYTDKAAMEKYLSGREKAYAHLFTEISPQVPPEHAACFQVNGQLLPGYTIAGEEPKTQEHTASVAAAEPTTQQQTAAATPKTPTEQSQSTAPAEEPTAPKTEAQPTNEPAQPNTTPAAAAIVAAPFVLTADNPRDKLKEITDKLENGIKGIFESEQYKTYLNTLSKFHNYSFNNCLLIAMQKPDATRVAGFNAWRKDFKRNVQKGEKGIKIIAPAPFKTKQEVDKLDGNGKPVIGADGKRVKEEKEVTIPAFTVATVFDVSQTDGEPLPQLGVSELTGSVEHYKEFFAAVEKVSPVPVDFEKIKTGAKGYFHLEEKRIAINEGMSDLQNLKTLIHEIAHARIHDIDKNAPKEEQPDRRTREVEAESIAYTVCQHYGLDTSDYSFGYVASWSGGKELDILKSSLDTIRKEADAIITEVDKHFAELTQDKTQTVEQTTEQAAEQTAPQGMVADQAPTPELQTALQGLQGEVKETLQWFMGEDMKNHGELRPLTLEMIAVQGFELKDGELVEAPPPNGTFSIYQVKDGNETRDIRFEPFDNLKQAPDMANYQHIYTAPLKHGDSLARIHLEFNLDKKPEDFRGRSVSISDVIVMNKDGKETAHYVDSVGFKELPGFLDTKEPTKEAPAVDLTIVADYFQKQNEKIQAADPSKTDGQAAFSTLTKRLEQANERIPDQHPELKALLVNAAQSPDLPTLQERMATLNTDFVQHYSTAVQNTIDTSGKAEPPAAAPTQQTDTPQPKAPAQGENVAAIEAKVKAGETINLSDLSDAIKKDKQTAQTAPTGKTGQTRPASRGKPTQEKPSIKEQIAAGKKQLAGDKSAPTRTATKNNNKGLED